MGKFTFQNVVACAVLVLLSACGNSSKLEATTAVSRASSDSFCQQSSWVAGITELCAGRLIYRDYVYDDYGADTGSLLGSSAVTLGPSAGDKTYPAGAENTADLVRLELWLEGETVQVEFELNTLYAPAQTISALAIDSDNNPATGGGAWPGLGINSQGWDQIYSFTDGNPDTNLIRGSFPRPAGTDWKIWAVVAQANGTVMNVAFRGADEQAGAAPLQTTSSSGNWFEDQQATALKAGDITAFAANVHVSDLSGAVTRAAAVAPGLHERVYTSAYTLPPGEGISAEGIPGRGDGGIASVSAQAFTYLGRYQPYGIYIPQGAAPHGIQMVFHGTATNMTSQINQPNMQRQFGEGLNRVLVTPLARGADGWGSDISERDLLDVMDDVEAHVPIDLDRVFSSGYSQGGYLGFRMAMLYPQRFAGFVSWSGFTGNSFNGPLEQTLEDLGVTLTAGSVGNMIDFVGNLRNIPGAMIYGGTDVLVHAANSTAMDLAFQAHDSLYAWFMHPVADHVTFILLDEWAKEAAYTRDLKRTLNPVRVSFRHDPTLGNPDFAIAHDRAYWIVGIRNRGAGYGDIDLNNHACGGSIPLTQGGNGVGDTPLPWVSDFRTQIGEQPVVAEPLIEGTLNNIATLSIDAQQTCLAGQKFAYRLQTDGPAEISFTDGRRLSLQAAGLHEGVL